MDKPNNQNQIMKTKTNTIQFNETAISEAADLSPWSAPTGGSYRDLVLKPEYVERRFKFPVGATWCRIVPALQGSTKGWMLGIHALDHPNGRHVHPRTLEPGEKSVFDHAYRWIKEHRPEDLYGKHNKENGIRLLPDPVCLFWVLITENDKTVARLILASGYDGSRGGAPGLGHKILQLSRERAEDGELVGDPKDPINGPQICVEKKQTPGSRYPSYSLRMGRVPAPIEELVAKMEPSEVDVLTPLEDVVHVPNREEEWELLAKMLDQETINEIKDSLD
jgi:hypothetical protein